MQRSWMLFVACAALVGGATRSPAGEEGCRQVDPNRRSQYIAYESHDREGQPAYRGESRERITLRFHNNITCGLRILGGAPLRWPPERYFDPGVQEGQQVFMDYEITDRKTKALKPRGGGCTLSLFVMPAARSVVFDIAANALKAGPVAVRFGYLWESGISGDVEHRVLFSAEDLPDEAKTWLTTVKR